MINDLPDGRRCPSCGNLLFDMTLVDVGLRDRWECRSCGAAFMLRLVRVGKSVEV